ncbi:hypothetical protein HDE_09384 [Halotydeus destructor]|nr:hypothetical protein HDE_09384 [Halotydeus destructor]
MKSMNMVQIILLLLIVNSVYSQNTNGRRFVYPEKPTNRVFKFESCSFDNIDSCARAIMFYGDEGTYSAKNEAEMKDYCTEVKTAIKCANEWSRKCLKGVRRQLMSLMLSGPAKNIKERCEPKGTRWYLNSYSCVTETRSDIDTCMDTLKTDFLSIKRNGDLNDWLPTACCFFSKFMSCFDQNIKSYCDEDSTKYLHWCRDHYIGDMVDLICPRESDHQSAKCSQLVAKIPTSNGTQETARSVLLPVYQMFQEYDLAGISSS